MKKIRGLMLALLLLLGCFSTVAYAENSDRVVDNADLLTDAEEALESIGELTGRTAKEEIVGAVFSRFCVGK